MRFKVWFGAAFLAAVAGAAFLARPGAGPAGKPPAAGPPAAPPALELRALGRVLLSAGPAERLEALRALDEKVRVGMEKEEVLRLFPPGALVERRDRSGRRWLLLEGELARRVLRQEARGLQGYFVRLDEAGRVREHYLLTGPGPEGER